MARRVADRERQRRYRARKRAERDRQTPLAIPDVAADPIGELVAWAAATLIVPPGHPLSGQPMIVPDFMARFLRDVWASPIGAEAALTVARKNMKTSGIAVLVLAHLVGPLRSPGWRGAVASVTVEKANELRRMVEQIAVASGIDGDLRFVRAPYPGRIVAPAGELDVLSADRSSGHALGLDLAIVDESGLLHERDRELVAGLRSSTSAKAGRLMHISIRGDSPLFAEVLADPTATRHVYEAPEGAAIDDEDAWHAANPGLALGIKSIDYMRAQAARVAHVPADAALFRAYDLNAPRSPSRELIVEVDDWRRIEGDLPPRDGPCVIGLDVGGSTSFTAAIVIWPSTGRAEAHAAVCGDPDIETRSRADGRGIEYPRMVDRGELVVLGAERTIDVPRFLRLVADSLEGETVAAVGADNYKRTDVETWIGRARPPWPAVTWRRQGRGPDGSADVRAMQRMVLERRVAVPESLLLRAGVEGSVLHYDSNGNVALDKASSRSRIDVISAFTVAAGLAQRLAARPPVEWPAPVLVE